MWVGCGQVSHLEGLPYDADSMLIKALSNEVVATIRELIKVNPLFKEHFNFYTQKIDVVDPFRVGGSSAGLAFAVTTGSLRVPCPLVCWCSWRTSRRR